MPTNKSENQKLISYVETLTILIGELVGIDGGGGHNGILVTEDGIQLLHTGIDLGQGKATPHILGQLDKLTLLHPHDKQIHRFHGIVGGNRAGR